MVMGHNDGQTRENTKDNGNKVSIMGMGNTLGQMVESSSVNLKTTKNKDMVNIYGPMGNPILDNGKTENNTE